jgi:hypothetical protein
VPRGDGQHQRAVQRAHHAAELLHGTDHPERDAAARRRVEVGHQREGRGHEPAAADALQKPAGHHARQVVGRRGHQRPEGEDDQRADEHRRPAAQVGDPADEGEDRDVAEQEAGHDRGGPLQLVDGQPDAGHHVRQRQHHDVGVGGGEPDRHGRERQQGPLRPGRAGHGAVMSWSVPYSSNPTV